MKAPEIRNPSENIEKTIHNMIKVFCKTCTKQQLRDFADHVQWTKSLYASDSAFTARKHLLHAYECPAKLDTFMKFVFGVEYRNDPPVMKAFLRQIQKFRINPRTVPLMDPERIHEDNTGVRIDKSNVPAPPELPKWPLPPPPTTAPNESSENGNSSRTAG